VDNLALDPDWSQCPPRRLWKQPIGAGWSGFAAVNGWAVTMEQRGEDELVTCYDARTGRLCWAHGVKARHSTTMGGAGPRCTPTIHQGKVYTLGATGLLHCLDGSSGTVVWSEDLLRRYGVAPDQEVWGVAWGRAASPLVVDQLLIVPAGGPAGGPYVSLAAFDKDSGRLVWEAGDRQVSYASPTLTTLAGMRQILIVNENSVTGHDVATGRVLWSHDWPGGSTSNASVSQAVPVGEDRVLLSKGYGGGAALLRLAAAGEGSLDARSLWRSASVLKTKFTNVVLHDGHVYGLSDGILECVDVATGERCWKRGRYGHGQVLGVRDLLLVQAESGEVILVEARPERFNEVGRFTALAGKTWNNLCLYGRLLLARNAQEAACYELTLVEPPAETIARD
jgi:outer membrane protein assembly factor BamB